MKILPNKINKFFDSILSKLSVPKKDRNLLIKSLLDSSIRGVDSHGIRLFSHYVKCIENGRIKAKPKKWRLNNKWDGCIYGSPNEFINCDFTKHKNDGCRWGE